MEYTTLASIKSYLWISDNKQDATLSSLITTCQRLIDIELGDSLEEKEVTRRMDGSGTNCIVMENLISSVSSVKDIRSNITYTCDYIEGYMVYLTSDTYRGVKNIEITYKKGYKSVPLDFEMYFLEFCKENYLKNKISNPDAKIVKNKKIGDLSVTYFSPTELISTGSGLGTPSMRDILSRYKNFSVIY